VLQQGLPWRPHHQGMLGLLLACAAEVVGACVVEVVGACVVEVVGGACQALQCWRSLRAMFSSVAVGHICGSTFGIALAARMGMPGLSGASNPYQAPCAAA
jgi:hypothetical protein